MRFTERLLWQLTKRHVWKREADFVVGTRADPYLLRWYIIPPNRFLSLYLHKFIRSDDDRALHDHRSFNISWLLSGAYWEHTIKAGGVRHVRRFRTGALIFRRGSKAHRISIDQPVWTLFLTGPTYRMWGFHCPHGWRPWREFVDDRDSGAVGKGCD